MSKSDDAQGRDREFMCTSRLRAAAVKAVAVLGGQLAKVARKIARRLTGQKCHGKLDVTESFGILTHLLLHLQGGCPPSSS